MYSFSTIRLVLFCLALLVVGCGRGDDTDEHLDRTAEAHEGDRPEANVVAQEPGMPVVSGPVTYGTNTGTTYAGFEAYPEHPDSVLEVRGMAAGDQLPGLILIHEWWGLNENMRAMARQIAGEGYRVLAVDLFGGSVAETPEAARGLVEQSMQNEQASLGSLAAAHAFLSQQRGSPQVGVMGYCFGGAMALNAALAMPEDLDALVIYYGRLTTDEDRLARLDMPVLGIFGADDQSIPVDQVRSFEIALQEAIDEPVQIRVFEGAGHAFANPSGTNFVPEAAREAWDLTTSFLYEHLYGQDDPVRPQLPTG